MRTDKTDKADDADKADNADNADNIDNTDNGIAAVMLRLQAGGSTASIWGIMRNVSMKKDSAFSCIASGITVLIQEAVWQFPKIS